MVITRTHAHALLAVPALVLALGACSSAEDAETRPTTTTSVPATMAPATTSTTVTPDPLEDQTPPQAVNGLEVRGDTIWVAALNSDQVLQIDRETGAILTRVETPGSSPDDVAVGPDGAVYWTGFGDGSVGRITGGISETIANVGAGANPIGFTDDGELIVGRAVTADGLYRVPLDGGEPEVIASAVGDMNAFVIDENDVVGPVGGVLGPGGVNAVDLTTREVSELGKGFPAGVTASALDVDGEVILLSPNGQVWRFDDVAGTVEPALNLPPGIYDNLDIAPDGTLYVTSFTEPLIVVVDATGTQRTLDIGG